MPVAAGRWPFLALGAASAAAVAFAGDEDGPVLCPWRRCTGAYCPGCGATRAAHHLLRGDVTASWAAHPMVLVVAVQVAVLALLCTRRSTLASLRTGRLGPRLLVGNAALLLAVWAFRLLTGAIPGFGGG